MEEVVIIRTFLHNHDAEMTKGLLDNKKVKNMIIFDENGAGLSTLSFGQTIKLAVRKEDVAIAEKILEILD